MIRYIANYQELEGLTGQNNFISNQGYVFGKVEGIFEGRLLVSPVFITEGDFDGFLKAYKNRAKQIEIKPIDTIETIPSHRISFFNPPRPYIKREKPLSDKQMEDISRLVRENL
jgi:hypothetical protein